MSESESLRMKKLEELSKNINSALRWACVVYLARGLLKIWFQACLWYWMLVLDWVSHCLRTYNIKRRNCFIAILNCDAFLHAAEQLLFFPSSFFVFLSIREFYSKTKSYFMFNFSTQEDGFYNEQNTSLLCSTKISAF